MSTPYFPFTYRNPARGFTYFAIEEIGEGGFGRVWSGISSYGVPIAIKIIKPSSNPARDLISWYNEQEIYLKCLQNPHIVTTYDQLRCDNGDLIIVMEQADENLADYSHRNGPIPASWVCAIGCQLCIGLEHIHNLGVIHRDITLRNVLCFANGIFKLADFGISKQTVSPDEFARTFIGFRNCVPPELLSLGYSTKQSDIYQLGLILLTLLTGKDAIPIAASTNEIHHAIRDGIPRLKAEQLIPQYGHVAAIISIMLRRRENWRYPNISAVARELQNEFSAQRFLEQRQNPSPEGNDLGPTYSRANS